MPALRSTVQKELAIRFARMKIARWFLPFFSKNQTNGYWVKLFWILFLGDGDLLIKAVHKTHVAP
jgi:hypothetical protein